MNSRMDVQQGHIIYHRNLFDFSSKPHQNCPICQQEANAQNHKIHSLQYNSNLSNKQIHSSKIGGQIISNSKRTEKMPPISEKRSPPMIKENAKKNISNGKNLCEKLTNRVPEILDFRESWLQEIEMYKDQMKAQQLLPHHNFHISEGCKITISRDSNGNIETSKRRRSRSDSDSQDKIRSSKDSDDKERAREDNCAPTHKNNSQNHHHINNNSNSHHKHVIVNGKNQLSSQPSLQLSSQIPKIIVNPYHASLLNNTSIADEKIKVLDVVSGPEASSMIDCNHGFPTHINGVNGNSKFNQTPITNKIEINTSTTSTDIVVAKSEEKEINSNDPTTVVINENAKIDNKLDHEDSDLDEDEEDFGDIDNDEFLDSSDSEDEYIGYMYLNDDDLNETADKQTQLSRSESLDSQYETPTSPFTPSLFPFVPPYLTFSSHVEKGPTMPPDVQKLLKWKLTAVMPKVVRRVVSNSGFRLIKKTNDWMGTWEKHMKSPQFKTIRSYQKFNHIPGSFKIGRKDSVWRNIRASITKHGKKEFGFMQKTFIMPQDLDIFKKSWPKFAKQNTKWIIKPPASARGTGIKVVSRWRQIPKSQPLIVQKYIERPLLINGSKFDLRLYVVVTSVNPLRVFMHTDGLARFASVQYSDKLDTLNDRCMHLTNYSINKLSANYAKNEDINACQGHKWTLKSLWSYFEGRGINTKRIWGTLRNLVVRTILSGEGGLNKMFKLNVSSSYSCYELFGFDVLLDQDLTPWLLEVNISPSLHSELPLDLHVKGPLVQAVLNTAMYQIPPKLTEEQETNIRNDYNLKSPLCYDKRLYVTHLSADEMRKHNRFTSKNVECREEYIDDILDDLTPDDIRCLIIAEDELARSTPLERIFPGPNSYKFLEYTDFPRYYNRLLDAWETRYANNREEGIEILQKLCAKKIHLKVSTMPKESCEREASPSEDDPEINDDKNETSKLDTNQITKLLINSTNERLNHDNNNLTI